MLDFEDEEAKIETLLSRIRTAKRNLKQERSALKAAKVEHKHALEARELLQHLAQAVQQKAHERISEVVSTCLKTVFPEDPYEFLIRFERKRGRTEARLLFKREGSEMHPLSAAGGGVVDVAAFALRVVTLALRRPPVTKLLVLDEPFKFVSEQYQDNVRQMLEALAHDMDLQIIMVTHNGIYETGLIHRL